MTRTTEAQILADQATRTIFESPVVGVVRDQCPKATPPPSPVANMDSFAKEFLAACHAKAEQQDGPVRCKYCGRNYEGCKFVSSKAGNIWMSEFGRTAMTAVASGGRPGKASPASSTGFPNYGRP